MRRQKIFVLLCLLVTITACSSNLVGLGVGSSLPVFSSNSDVFSGEELFTVTVDDGVSLIANPENLSGVFVHNVAYVGVVDWEPVELVARDSSLSDFWIQGPADASLTKDELVVLLNEQGIEDAEELYVLLYVCRLYDLGDEGFLDIITPAQKGVMEDLFDGVRGYLCGVERFTNDGLINHNRWSLATVDVSGLFDQPVNALCSSNNQTFSYDIEFWPNNDFCVQGTLQGTTPGFPEEGASVTWSCQGVDGGANAQCSASRNENPDFCATIPSLEEATDGRLVRAQDILLLRSWDAPRDGFEFEEVFGLPFPGESGRQKNVRFFPGTYASMRFVTPDNLHIGHGGTFAFEVLQGTFAGRRLIAISRCEGDFNVDTVGSQCIRSAVGSQSLSWRGLSSDWECPLEPDTEYFFNLVYTYAPVGTDPSEIEWACGLPDATRCGNTVMPSFSYSSASCGVHAREFAAHIQDWPVLPDVVPNFGFCSVGLVSSLPVFPGVGEEVSWVCGPRPTDSSVFVSRECFASRGE